MTLIDSEPLKTFLMKSDEECVRNLKEAYDMNIVKVQQGKLIMITRLLLEIERLEKCQK